MARFVRFDEDAERRFARIPDGVRRLVTDNIIAIAEHPDPTSATDWRPVAGDGVNSGLLLSVVLHGRIAIFVVYRIRSERDEVWIQDIMLGYNDE